MRKLQVCMKHWICILVTHEFQGFCGPPGFRDGCGSASFVVTSPGQVSPAAGWDVVLMGGKNFQMQNFVCPEKWGSKDPGRGAW